MMESLYGKMAAALVALFAYVSVAQAQVNAPSGPPVLCNSSVVYDASSNGATELVALATGKTIYVCGYTILGGGTALVDLRYGTGSACATGGTKITPAYSLVAQTGVSDSSVAFRGLKSAVSTALCLNTSAGVAIQAVVYYSQF